MKNRCMENPSMGADFMSMDSYPEAIPSSEATSMPKMMGGCCGMGPQTMMCPPVMECPQERCCHRVINYEVPHIIPCHTRMINHHIYRHTYQPCYSYSEEDEYSQIYDQPCCK